MFQYITHVERVVQKNLPGCGAILLWSFRGGYAGGWADLLEPFLLLSTLFSLDEKQQKQPMFQSQICPKFISLSSKKYLWWAITSSQTLKISKFFNGDNPHKKS